MTADFKAKFKIEEEKERTYNKESTVHNSLQKPDGKTIESGFIGSCDSSKASKPTNN